MCIFCCIRTAQLLDLIPTTVNCYALQVCVVYDLFRPCFSSYLPKYLRKCCQYVVIILFIYWIFDCNKPSANARVCMQLASILSVRFITPSFALFLFHIFNLNITIKHKKTSLSITYPNYLYSIYKFRKSDYNCKKMCKNTNKHKS